jgi:hypothetical protein
MIQNNPKLLSSSDLMKINRCVSYITFILKEIYDFTTAKLTDETPVYKMRKLSNKINDIKSKINLMSSQN